VRNKARAAISSTTNSTISGNNAPIVMSGGLLA
jgi:hypothetical protein